MNERLTKTNVRVNEFENELKKWKNEKRKNEKIDVNENVWKFENEKSKIDDFVVEKKRAIDDKQTKHFFFFIINLMQNFHSKNDDFKIRQFCFDDFDQWCHEFWRRLNEFFEFFEFFEFVENRFIHFEFQFFEINMR